MTLSSASAKIGVIVCSNRVKRAGPQIATFVLNTLRNYQQTHSSTGGIPYTLSLIDLADHPLPMYPEPGMPAKIADATEYIHGTTIAWSELINSYQAFVFVTPQYNGGYPAGTKLAIDYLFREWRGKPGLVVSYGARGGGMAADQLKQILRAVQMKVVEKSPGLRFPSWGYMQKAAIGENMGLDGDAVDENGEKLWEKQKVEIGTAFRDLLDFLNEKHE